MLDQDSRYSQSGPGGPVWAQMGPHPHPRLSLFPPTLSCKLETWDHSNVSKSFPQTPPKGPLCAAPGPSLAPSLVAKTSLYFTLQPPLAPTLEMTFP